MNCKNKNRIYRLEINVIKRHVQYCKIAKEKRDGASNRVDARNGLKCFIECIEAAGGYKGRRKWRWCSPRRVERRNRKRVVRAFTERAFQTRRIDLLTTREGRGGEREELEKEISLKPNSLVHGNVQALSIFVPTTLTT